jgi:hypothetical protein
MNRSTRRDPDGNAARAFARVGWEPLLERLLRYTTCTLRYAAIDAETCGVVEATDLVNTLCARGLAGEIEWKLPPAATSDEVVGYLCKKLKGMRSNLRQHDAVAASDGDEGLRDVADDAPDALESAVWRSHLYARRSAIVEDPEALRLLAAYCEGHTERKEAAEHLGWPERKVKTVRLRMMRRFKAKGYETTEESEAEPPRSGPPWSHHEPQATEERQGTPRKPARGAQPARR